MRNTRTNCLTRVCYSLAGFYWLGIIIQILSWLDLLEDSSELGLGRCYGAVRSMLREQRPLWIVNRKVAIEIRSFIYIQFFFWSLSLSLSFSLSFLLSFTSHRKSAHKSKRLISYSFAFISEKSTHAGYFIDISWQIKPSRILGILVREVWFHAIELTSLIIEMKSPIVGFRSSSFNDAMVKEMDQRKQF